MKGSGKNVGVQQELTAGPVLSIIIVNWNTSDLLCDCLTSVDDNLCGLLDFEIYVVDNASADDSVSMVQERFPNVHLIANTKNRGFVYANNQASKVAKGKYLLVLNSDTVLKDPGLNKIIEFMESNADVGIATGRMEYEDGGFQSPCFRYPSPLMILWRQSVGRLSSRLVPFIGWSRYQSLDFGCIHDVDWVTGAYLFIRRELLDNGRVFDDAIFMYYEDLLLCMRVHRAGFRVVYLPYGNVVHLGGESSKKIRAQSVLHSFQGSVVYLSKRNGRMFGRIYRLLVRGVWHVLLLLLYMARPIMGNVVTEKIELYRYLLKEELYN